MAALPNAPGPSASPPPRRAQATRVRGCRVVSWSESARLLLRGQLEALSDIDWSVVSGDEYLGAPSHLTTYRVPMRRELRPSDLRSFLQLYLFFRRHRFTFVQTHTPKASLIGLPAARLTGHPALYTMHGCLFFKDNSRVANVAGWAFERWCASWANRVLLQSKEDVDVVTRARICRPDKVTYVGNGIDVQHFARSRQALPRDDEPVVLMISRLVAEKGCRDFFQVARALRGRARFVHVGPVETDQRDAISADEIDRLASAGDVEFLGPAQDIRPALARASLTLLPSYREGIPRVAMEAAAAGRAVAGYDIRGLREVIPPRLGLLVPRGDVDALTRLVEGLLDDPHRLTTLGDACHDWVVREFSEAAVVERLRDVYAEVTGES